MRHEGGPRVGAGILASERSPYNAPPRAAIAAPLSAAPGRPHRTKPGSPVSLPCVRREVRFSLPDAANHPEN
jgi:hypothetical protein